MELSGAVLRRSPIGSGAGLGKEAGKCFFGSSVARDGRRVCVSARPWKVSGGGRGFSDEGHIQYYLPPVRCDVRKKEEKKRAKLVKGLSKDLSAFYSMGFGADADAGEAVAGEKGKMIAEAAELLLSQLKQLRAEEKELKRKRKQEKAARMKDRADDGTSSSSSSESSDGDCDTVVRVSALRTEDPTEPRPDSNSACSQASLPLELDAERRSEESHIALKPGMQTMRCCSSSAVIGKPEDRIEVCMGGKCKKSGALELLAEFERKVGAEGAVVGCKCMGKCRDGPNVRVLNRSKEEDSVQTSRSPLCIGVGLEDVGSIVANFFGEKEGLSLLAA